MSCARIYGEPEVSENFVPAVACHFCKVLPEALSQPGARLFPEIEIESVNCIPILQSDWIRQNCATQMERVRDNYNGYKGIRQYGTSQLHSAREQYYEQVRHWREVP